MPPTISFRALLLRGYGEERGDNERGGGPAVHGGNCPGSQREPLALVLQHQLSIASLSFHSIVSLSLSLSLSSSLCLSPSFTHTHTHPRTHTHPHTPPPTHTTQTHNATHTHTT